jgi:lipopolysaccharide export system permease protein
VGRIAAAALVAGLALVAVEVVLGEFLAPQLQAMAKKQKAFEKYSNISLGGGGGAWVRDGNLILNVTQRSSERQFGGMMVFELSPEHRLRAIGRAARATSRSDRTWLLSGYGESRFTEERVLARTGGSRVLASNLSGEFLGLAVTEPNDIETLGLWNVIRFFRANDLDAGAYVFAFWSRIARTLAIAFAVLLAVPFVLGSLRSAGAGARTMVGLLLGVGFFLMQRLIESGTVVFALDPVLLAWLPTGLLALVTFGLLARAR